ncbi:extracellular solute-binding protein [Bacillus alkalicellulosilyticus]|uniref:extracellular solute-binding protein n=1 Tax=Alkalihalobacterium alkalicellulosilyticum TaxID=1912214 RepID=UPI000997E007|nr:extracellular solute-binding protein [Bacillus alkalicellulosilyticus]
MKKKWFQGFILSLAFLFFVVACSNSTTNENPSNEENKPDETEVTETTDEKVSLSFRHIWVAEHEQVVKEIYDEVLADFQAAHPNINIETEGMDQETHREQKLKAEMVAGNPPDLFVMWGGSELDPYINAERMLDLTDFLEETGLKEKFVSLEAFTKDGRVYGLPLEGFGEGIYYNKEIFEEVGVNPPETIDDLIEISKKIKDAGYTPISLANQDKWPGGMIWQFFLDRYAGHVVADIIEGKGSWENPEYIEATEKFIELISAGGFTEGANGLPYDQQSSAFINGDAAMVLTGSWEAELFDSNAEFADKVGFMNFPKAEGSSVDQERIVAGYSFGIGLSSNLEGAKKEAAVQLLETMLSEEVQQRIVYEAKRVPALKLTVDPLEAGVVFSKVLNTINEASETYMAYDNIIQPSVRQAYFNNIQSMLNGNITAEDALKNMQQVQNETE